MNASTFFLQLLTILKKKQKTYIKQENKEKSYYNYQKLQFCNNDVILVHQQDELIAEIVVQVVKLGHSEI